MGEEYDLMIYCEGDKVVGAGAEDVTAKEYKTMLFWLKNNGFTKTVEGHGSTDKVDLWVSSDTKWKVRVKYTWNSAEKLFEILLTTGLKWAILIIKSKIVNLDFKRSEPVLFCQVNFIAL